MSFVLVEMADVELIGVRLFAHKSAALEAFEAACEENRAYRVDDDDLAREVAGTVALAGDDAYSVQLIECEEKGYAFICGDGRRFATFKEATTHASQVHKRTGAVIAVDPLTKWRA